MFFKEYIFLIVDKMKRLIYNNFFSVISNTALALKNIISSINCMITWANNIRKFYLQVEV